MNEKQFGIPDNYCDAVMHCKDNAGVLLLKSLYQLLTSRQSVCYTMIEKFTQLCVLGAEL